MVGSIRVGGVGWGPIAELGTVLLAGCGLHRGQLWNLLTLVVYQDRAVGVLLVCFGGGVLWWCSCSGGGLMVVRILNPCVCSIHFLPCIRA
jgi:hypothetical protein